MNELSAALKVCILLSSLECGHVALVSIDAVQSEHHR
jgi:hypothetical protein